MRSTKLGVIYNDQMWDSVNLWVNEFNLKADTMRPRKRPMSLASPSIVLDEDGNVRMVIGAAGGKYIATALAQVRSTTRRSNLGRFSFESFSRQKTFLLTYLRERLFFGNPNIDV